MSKMINALIAKTAEEARDLNLTDRVYIKPSQEPTTPPDLVPVDALSDEEFDRHIQRQLENDETEGSEEADT